MNSVKEIETQSKTRMEKAIADFQHEVSTLRTGRASVNMLDGIRVDYYGTPTPLNQLANLHVPEPGMITVQPWDISQIGAIEKAIRTSDLGINPANDGKMIRLPDSAAQRRAAETDCEASPRYCRGSPRRLAKYSPGCERKRQKADQGENDRGRRRAPGS